MRISTQQVLLGFLRKGFRRVVASEEILEHFLSNLGVLGRNYVKKPVSGYGAETSLYRGSGYNAGYALHEFWAGST